MKKILVIFLILLIIIPFQINVYANESAGGTGGSSGNVEGGVTRPWYYNDSYPGNSAIKITVYKSDGTKIGSKFFVNDSNDLNLLNNNAYIRTNYTDRLSETVVQGNWIKSSSDTFKYFSFSQVIGNTLIQSIESFLSNLTEETVKTTYGLSNYGYDDLKNLVLIIEPATTVKKSSGDYYVATYWDMLALTNYDSGFKSNIVTPFKDLGTAISIKSSEISQTGTPGIWSFLSHFNAFQGNVTQQQSLGVAIILYGDLFSCDPGAAECPIEDSQNITYNCPIEVNLNSCGDSSITEPTDKECILNNKLYLYNEICNVYCTEKIETNFKGIYNTFKGNNIYSAIPGGRYIPIKDSPKITINKTCYQSTSNAECRDWKTALEKQVNDEYGNKRSETELTVDSNNYTLFDENPSIELSTNENDKVTYQITYEHKMDPNINKYISIETGKDVGNKLEKYEDQVIIFNNENGTIITKKSSFGTYEYSFNISSTKLNKYINGSNNLTKIVGNSYSKVTASVSNGLHYNTTYTYNFNNTINKNYSSTDLKFNCEYVKANPCICPTNTICDPVTCEPVIDTPCTCNSECGCKDNKTCDPIPCDEEKCDPTKEMCYIYRPISLINPFPGINGNNRTPGNNWDKITRDENGNIKYYKGAITSLSDYYIKYNRGYKDYEIYQAEPLYVIKLDSNKIKAIREYNDYKDHDYNDSDLDCDNGKNCISKFLRGRAEHFHINLIDSGTCKNITHNTFNSCITRGN